MLNLFRESTRMAAIGCLSSVVLLGLCGCDDAETTDPATSEKKSVDTATGGAAAVSADQSPAAADNDVLEFRPLTMNSLGKANTSPDGGQSGRKLSGEEHVRNVIDNLKPLQAMLGQWRGTTRKEFDKFKAVDSLEWVWDLQSDPEQPALAIESDKSPYLRSGRITWDSANSVYQLTAVDQDGTERHLVGKFTDAVHDELRDDDKYHKVFRVEFNETGEAADGEQWQLAFVKQETDRYLMEVGKRRGKADFSRYDVVSTQREGTSFAISDSDYKEKTCIISEGLGTTEVTYKGRSYWVCCSGCKAAFDEDPEKWIARAAARAAEKK